jgi:hypothetical protein
VQESLKGEGELLGKTNSTGTGALSRFAPRLVAFALFPPQPARERCRSLLHAERNDKEQILLTHSQLKTKEDADNLKTGWAWALTSLKTFLETGKPIRYDEWEKSLKKSSPR